MFEEALMGRYGENRYKGPKSRIYSNSACAIFSYEKHFVRCHLVSNGIAKTSTSFQHSFRMITLKSI